MIPRGEVGLIFATIGLHEGHPRREPLRRAPARGAGTTLMTPPLLRWRLDAMRAGRRRSSDSTEPRPAGGWLAGATTASSTSPATRPPRLALEIALDAAPAVADGARPGPKLLDWIGEWSDTPVALGRRATTKLFAVLTDGDVRAWRFLETTGVLERALPELAEAVDRRRERPVPARSGAGVALRTRRTDPRDRRRPTPWPRPSTRSSSIPSGCCSPRSSSTPPARTLAGRSSPGASLTGSISARPPSSRSPCSSATRGCCRGRRAKVDGLEEERGLPDRDPPRQPRAGTCALSPDAGDSASSTPGSVNGSTSCSARAGPARAARRDRTRRAEPGRAPPGRGDAHRRRRPSRRRADPARAPCVPPRPGGARRRPPGRLGGADAGARRA